MSHPRRSYAPGAPPLPVQAGLGAMHSAEEDMGPTGEHASPEVLEISGADLVPEVSPDALEEETPSAAAQPPPRPRRPSSMPPHRSDGRGSYGPDPAGPAPLRSDGRSSYGPDPAGPAPLAGGPPSPFDHTMPPQPRMPVAFEPLRSDGRGSYGSDPADPAPLAGEPEVEPAENSGVEPLEAAPTRVEREEDIIAGEDGATPQVLGPRLLVIGGNNRGKEFPLKFGDNSIGRGMDNDAVLADIAVSRKHTLVCFELDHFVVRDLGSGNGTLLNGKRVETHRLQDGDQLELGNTLLRFLSPATVEPLAQMSTVITPRDQVQGVAVGPEARHATLDIPRRARRETMKAAQPAGRTKKLLVFGGLGVLALLGLMIGVKAIIGSKKKQPEVAAVKARQPDQVVAEEYSAGIREFNAKNWEKAGDHFGKALALAPSQASVRHYLEQAKAEIVARDALEKGRTNLAASDFAAARKELAKIKADSAYRADAEALVRRVDEAQVRSLLDSARSLKETGNVEAALEKLKEAQAIAPTASAVQALHAELTEPSGAKKDSKKDGAHKASHAPTPIVKATPPSKGSKGTPVKKGTPKAVTKTQQDTKPIKVTPSGQGKAALALYKKKQWGQALQAMKEFAAAQRGKKQKAANALADAIQAVGQNWGRAEKAAGNPALALGYYKAALAADARIERGSHQKALKEQLVKAARGAASTALARKQYRAAYDAVKEGERYGGKGDPALQRIVAALEKAAQQVFDKAYYLKSSNLAKARQLWQEVLRMVPPGSPIYQKAYGWLNSGGRGSQDEDED
jgi:pSer/pThr/pTyr-binding forkhead associated (FHA) protein/tetratricopeptide (TPR) repeat protein